MSAGPVHLVRHWAVSIPDLWWDIEFVWEKMKIFKARGPPQSRCVDLWLRINLDCHLANRVVLTFRKNELRNIAHYIYRFPQTIQPSIEDTARKMRQYLVYAELFQHFTNFHFS